MITIRSRFLPSLIKIMLKPYSNSVHTLKWLLIKNQKQFSTIFDNGKLSQIGHDKYIQDSSNTSKTLADKILYSSSIDLTTERQQQAKQAWANKSQEQVGAGLQHERNQTIRYVICA